MQVCIYVKKDAASIFWIDIHIPRKTRRLSNKYNNTDHDSMAKFWHASWWKQFCEVVVIPGPKLTTHHANGIVLYADASACANASMTSSWCCRIALVLFLLSWYRIDYWSIVILEWSAEYPPSSLFWSFASLWDGPKPWKAATPGGLWIPPCLAWWSQAPRPLVQWSPAGPSVHPLVNTDDTHGAAAPRRRRCGRNGHWETEARLGWQQQAARKCRPFIGFFGKGWQVIYHDLCMYCMCV